MLRTVIILITATSVDAFSSALFQESPALKTTAPSRYDGVDVELPDFDELFNRIQQVSPLARQIIHGAEPGRTGFSFIDDTWPSNLKWKNVESKRRRLVHQIDKIDNFQGHPAPIVRFRSSMEGLCDGEFFATFTMDLEHRKRWDPQIDEVSEIHPLRDLDSANMAMGFGKYGDCVRAGIGYCRTKAALGISPREQLTLCGIQSFPCGSTIIWGTEMEECHNNLFPEGERTTRAKSHLFSIALTPTSSTTFDVEYVLQLEVGLPAWLTNPILYDTIKNLFRTVDGAYRGKCDTLEKFLREKEGRDKGILQEGPLMSP